MDVLLIQVRPLPTGGYTLGVVSDFTHAMIQRARVVIALLNPALPLMQGDCRVEAQDIDWLVDGDDRLIDMPDPQPTALEQEVARRVAEFVPDRATVQLGIGTLPAAVTWPVKKRPKAFAASITARYPAIFAIELSTSSDCAREMRGTASIASAVMRRRARSASKSGLSAGLISEMTVVPSRSRSS